MTSGVEYGIKVDMVTDLKLVLTQMTITQKRRYLYYLKGWSLTRIAKKEDVSVEAVRKSINSGRKRGKNRLIGLKKG